MIVTEKITLTRKELFKILITSYLKKRWWLVAWIWIMVVLLLLLKQGDSFAYFIIAALILFQGVMVYQFWTFANNELFLQDRHYKIDSDKVDVIIVNDTSTSIETRLFRSVERNRKYYLLYTSKIDFIYLPVNSFKSIGDREWFEKEIIKKILK